MYPFNVCLAFQSKNEVSTARCREMMYSLMSEYCPDSRRATLTNAMFCGFPLGAAFGGFLAAWMIPHFGWRPVPPRD